MTGQMNVPDDLKCVGDLFPHRFSPARDDEGFAMGNLMPCDSGPWISTVHAFKVAKGLIERVAKLEAENAELVRKHNEQFRAAAQLAEGFVKLNAENARLSAPVTDAE